MTATDAPAAMRGRWATLGSELRRPLKFVDALLRRFSWHHMPTLAAGLAFYFLLAFFPFLLFLLAVVTIVPGVEGVIDWLLVSAARFLPPEAYTMAEGVIRSVLGVPRGGFVSLGVALALWSASSGFSSVTECLNVAYGVTSRRAWWRARLEALSLTIALSFFVIVAFVLTLFAGPLAQLVASHLGPAGGIAVIAFNWTLSLALMTLVTATVYYVCPDVDEQTWEWMSPGVLLFIVGFGGASLAFSMWVSRFASYDKTYGSLAAPILLMFWLYLLSVCLLLGGELNAYLDEQRARVAAEVETAPPAIGKP